MNIINILNKEFHDKDDIIALLSISDESELELLRAKAEEILFKHTGDKVFLRGLIEFSNYCVNDCNYCGIRKSANVGRYTLKMQDIIDSALWSASQGYGSAVLQSGERRDEAFVDFVCEAIRNIKEKTKSVILPEGLGITLSVGEQSEETYRRFFEAGAKRYLLRIESSNQDLFSKIHPKEQSFENRYRCLKSLQSIGFQTGTGVMIGLPGQTIEDLANDVLFFRDNNIDMIGMGPFIPSADTPMNAEIYPWDKERNLSLALKMIAVSRIVLKDVNIASTTALQAIKDGAREDGLRFGANVIMPQQTPQTVRKDYQLYDGKPFLSESLNDLSIGLRIRVESIGRKLALNEQGDPLHFFNRNSKF
jgi:biotin synthase